MKKIRVREICAGLLLALSLSGPAWAQGSALVVDADKLATELQQSTSGKQDLNLVWWIPEAYWRAILVQEKVPKENAAELSAILRPYTVVAVFDGTISQTGGTTFRSEAELRRTMRVIDANGVEYSVLEKDKIGPGAAGLLDIIRPMLSNALGKLGANFHFLVFPGLNAKGEPIADPSRSGSLRIRVEKGRELTWQLPLPSLVAPKKCPIDGQVMNGTWNYCPWHGAELKSQP